MMSLQKESGTVKLHLDLSPSCQVKTIDGKPLDFIPEVKIPSLQKESEWENKECEVRWKEHGTFNVVCGAPYPCSTHTSKEERNKWIKELLSNREKEIAEEVEKRETIIKTHTALPKAYFEGYEQAKSDFLSILKH